jgi:methylmalonyl-CoA mutase N-terminal domain/subunit
MTISEKHKKWREGAYQKTIEKFPERKKEFKTSWGDIVEPIYVPGDGCPYYEEKLGFPGEYPFTAAPADFVPR